MNVEEFEQIVKVLRDNPDWRPFYYYCDTHPNVVIRAGDIEGIRRQLIKETDLPEVSPGIRGVQFVAARASVNSEKLVAALLEQTQIKPGHDWSTKLAAELERIKNAPKRGRPRKEEVVDESVEEEPSKKRGRPPKQVVEEPNDNSV